MTASTFDVQGDGRFQVAVDPAIEDVLIVSGPAGPPGPPGPSFDGVAWWTGEGEPAGIVGSKPGDYYINTLDGSIYKLGD